MSSVSIRPALAASSGDHVAAASQLRLRGASGNANRFAVASTASSVDRRHDTQILGQHAVSGIGSGQQRNDLDHPFLSDPRRLPAVRPPDDDIGEIRRVEQSVRPLNEDGADLLDEAIEVEDVREIEPPFQGGPELGVRDLLRLKLLPSAGVNENGGRKIEFAVGEGPVKLVPNEKRKAEDEKRLLAVRAYERLDRLPVDLQLRVEGEGGLGAELHHSENPAAAGGEVGWLDHVFRVDRQEREAAGSENWPKRSDKRFRLAARSLIVDDDATRPLARRAARAHHERRRGRAFKLHFLEQADRQIGNLRDVAIGLEPAPCGVEDPRVFGAPLVVMTGELVQPFEKDRLLLRLTQRIRRLVEETLKHAGSPSVARS